MYSVIPQRPHHLRVRVIEFDGAYEAPRNIANFLVVDTAARQMPNIKPFG